MTTYVLIVVLYYAKSGFTAEFATKDKCEDAGKAVVTMVGRDIDILVQYKCVEK